MSTKGEMNETSEINLGQHAGNVIQTEKRKKRKMLKLSERLWCVLLTLLSLVGVWLVLFSFPTISITTSELKTRSLFIDEHAIMVQSKGMVRLWYDSWSPRTPPESASWDVCERYSSYLHAHCMSINTNNNGYALYEVMLKQGRQESILLAFQASQKQPSSVRFARQTMDMLADLSQSTTWLVKDITILYIELGVDLDERMGLQKAVKDWLHNTAAGGLREAYLFDLAGAAGNSSFNNGGDSQYWQGMDISVQGRNGQLANMDLLSAALHFFPSQLTLPALSSVSPAMDQLARLHYMPLVKAVVGELFPRKVLEDMEKKVSGLWQCFASALRLSVVETDLSFLQAELLDGNVDTVAFAMRWQEENASSVTWTLADFHLMVLQFVHLSNYLYEELHHSFFYYLTLGNQHFLGITEYSVACVALFLPLLNHFLWLAFDHQLTAVDDEKEQHFGLQRDRQLWSSALCSLGLELSPVVALLLLLPRHASEEMSDAVMLSMLAWLQILFLLDLLISVMNVFYEESVLRLQSKLSVLLLVVMLSLAVVGVQHVVLYVAMAAVAVPVLTTAAHSFYQQQTVLLSRYRQLHRIGDVDGSEVLSTGMTSLWTVWSRQLTCWMLLWMAVVLSPCGLLCTVYFVGQGSHAMFVNLLQDFCQNGSLVFPAVLWISALTSKFIVLSIQRSKVSR